MHVSTLLDFVTERELAQETGASVFTVRRWRKDRGLRSVKLGREWHVRREWFVEWLDIQSRAKVAPVPPSASLERYKKVDPRNALATGEDMRRALSMLDTHEPAKGGRL